MRCMKIFLYALSLFFIVFFLGSDCFAFKVGPLSIGGAIRANYVNGDYTKTGTSAPQRGDNGGNFSFNLFRINLDYAKAGLLGKVEYRWYDGYNFLHTGWVGYKTDDFQVQVGVNRAPFGVGAYGPANSWFLDQHFYVGLSDDMDMGIKFITSFGNLSLDLAYYYQAEPKGRGGTREAARYSYDVVDNGSEYAYYEENHQFNVRGIYSMEFGDSIKEDLGISLQGGRLKATRSGADDTLAYACSVHSKTAMDNWVLMLQVTQYDYGAKYKEAGLTEDLIAMGAFDFAWPVANSGLIPAVALSYTWKPGVEWIDSVTFYNDYSVIIKNGKMPSGRDFEDCALNVTGIAIASGGWYIYVDYAYSNGNYFVGNKGDIYSSDYAGSEVGDFGANGNDAWNGRFNINFGYYF